MIEEILPGLAHWGAFHDPIGNVVHSALVLRGVLFASITDHVPAAIRPTRERLGLTGHRAR